MSIECFMAAAETLNFTSAAELVHITQPAFSRHIANYEREIGMQLFWRSKQNGLRITPAGLAIYEGVKQIDRDYSDLLDKAGQISRGEIGRLNIGVPGGLNLSEDVFASIRKFQERYPNVEVVVQVYKIADLLDALQRGICDAIITPEIVIKGMEGLLSEVISKDKSYLLVPARLGCDPNKKYKITDFKDEVFVLSKDFPHLNEMFIEMCRGSGFEPKTKMTEDYESKLMTVELGDGVAISSKNHYCIMNSKYVTSLEVEGLQDSYYVVAWEKNNFNSVIALFYSTLEEIDTNDYNRITGK